jgi:biopolymer transport protein TolQ
METDTLAMAQEIDFSMLALFARATLTVKIVMLMLIIMSFWSWAIIIQKHLMLMRARGEASIFDRAFWSGEPLDELVREDRAEPQGRVGKHLCQPACWNGGAATSRMAG